MGIVIINGKRYDSITGLMIQDQNTEAKQEETNMANEKHCEVPSWIMSYVNMRAEERKLDEAAADNRATTAGEFTVSQAVEPAATANSSNAKVMRRRAGASQTLNRRFVHKPLDEQGDYTKSIAEQQIAAHQAAKRHIAIEPEAEQPEEKPYEWHMVVGANSSAKENTTESQIESQTASFGNPNTNPYDTFAELDDQRNVAATDQTIEELNKILHSAREIDDSSVRKVKQSKKVGKNIATTKQKKARRRISLRTALSTAGALGVVVAVGVYIAMPTISVKMAASKAGIDAKNPYAPKGYTIDGKVAYGKGKVVINYHGKNDGDGYTVTQEKSDQTTSELLSDLTSKGETYDEVRTSDKSIYLTSDNATWVENGIKYTIKGNDYLDTEQISDIAASL